MISADRFIVNELTDHDGWIAARKRGITATTVRDASTPAGFQQVIENRRNPDGDTFEGNDYTKFGNDNEPWIAMWVKHEYGIMPNSWLIAHETNPLFMATPDGLSLDHARISEIKTGGKDIKSPPLAHRRQIQFQLLVTGAEKAIYAYMLRAQSNGVFVPGWFEPKTWVIERDEKMIAELVITADLLLTDFESWKEVA